MRTKFLMQSGIVIGLCLVVLFWGSQNCSGVAQPQESVSFHFDQIDTDLVDAGMDHPVLVPAPSPLMIWVRRIFTPIVVFLTKWYDSFSYRWKRLSGFFYSSSSVNVSP